MSQRKLRFVTLGNGTITYADPSNVANTAKFTHANTQRNTVAGLVPHTRAEYIASRNAVRQVGDLAVPEVLSCRIKVSGALSLASEQKQHVLDSLENFRIAVEGGLLEGFLPNQTTEFVIDTPLV